MGYNRRAMFEPRVAVTAALCAGVACLAVRRADAQAARPSAHPPVHLAFVGCAPGLSAGVRALSRIELGALLLPPHVAADAATEAEVLCLEDFVDLRVDDVAPGGSLTRVLDLRRAPAAGRV